MSRNTLHMLFIILGPNVTPTPIPCILANLTGVRLLQEVKNNFNRKLFRFASWRKGDKQKGN